MFLWISVFKSPCFKGYPFGYPWISMDIHALTCYGFSIQGTRSKPPVAYRTVLPDFTTPTLNAVYFLTKRDNFMINPIFEMLSSSANQNILDMPVYL